VLERLDLHLHSLAIQTVGAMQQPMLMRIFVAASLAGLLVAPDATAQQRRLRDQDEVLRARQSGQVMPLNQIESRIVPGMSGADYLGPEFDASSGVYRLKFMRGGRVIWVDVDGRTGQVLGRSGN
jgi:hypothetical protein